MDAPLLFPSIPESRDSRVLGIFDRWSVAIEVNYPYPKKSRDLRLFVCAALTTRPISTRFVQNMAKNSKRVRKMKAPCWFQSLPCGTAVSWGADHSTSYYSVGVTFLLCELSTAEMPYILYEEGALTGIRSLFSKRGSGRCSPKRDQALRRVCVPQCSARNITCIHLVHGSC